MASSCRSSEKAFKGMEFYSWEDENGAWWFSILTGTNRNKSASEVTKFPITMHDIKREFCQLAKGEEIFWMPNMLGSVSDPAYNFSLPPEEMIKEINALATACQVKLITFDK